jgi:hypothetical protein
MKGILQHLSMKKNIANLVEFISSPTKLNIYFCYENATV